MGREGPDQGRKERAGAGLIDRPGAGGWCESEARTSGCGCGTCRATRGWGRWMMTCMPCRNVWRTGPPMRHCHSPGVRCGWASERARGRGRRRARKGSAGSRPANVLWQRIGWETLLWPWRGPCIISCMCRLSNLPANVGYGRSSHSATARCHLRVAVVLFVSFADLLCEKDIIDRADKLVQVDRTFD